MDRSMGQAHIFIIMEINILEIIKKGLNMDKELLNIKTEIYIMEISQWVKNMDRVNMIIIMETNTLDNLVTINNLDQFIFSNMIVFD